MDLEKIIVDQLKQGREGKSFRFSKHRIAFIRAFVDTLLHDSIPYAYNHIDDAPAQNLDKYT